MEAESAASPATLQRLFSGSERDGEPRRSSASVDTFSSDAQKRHTVVPRTVRCLTGGVTEWTMGKSPLEGVEADSSATLRIIIIFLIAG